MHVLGDGADEDKALGTSRPPHADRRTSTTPPARGSVLAGEGAVRREDLELTPTADGLSPPISNPAQRGAREPRPRPYRPPHPDTRRHGQTCRDRRRSSEHRFSLRHRRRKPLPPAFVGDSLAGGQGALQGPGEGAKLRSWRRRPAVAPDLLLNCLGLGTTGPCCMDRYQNKSSG